MIGVEFIDGSEALAMNVSVLSEKSRVEIQVLTRNGIYTYLLPKDKDIMFQYLMLLVHTTAIKHPCEELIKVTNPQLNNLDFLGGLLILHSWIGY